MPYYVVNAGRGRSTHIMKSKSPRVPDVVDRVVAELMYFGGRGKLTLCGLTATRYVDVLKPEEASCRECKKRWQLAMAADATKTPEQRQRAKASSWVSVVVILAVVLAAVLVYLVAHGNQ